MDTSTITFDQLPHVVIGPSEKLDRSLDLLEKLGVANLFKQHPPQRKSALDQKRRTLHPHHLHEVRIIL